MPTQRKQKLKVFAWPSYTSPPGVKMTIAVHCVALAPSKRSIVRERGDDWRVTETENEEDVRVAHANPGKICVRREHGSREDRGRWWFRDPKQPFTDPFPKKEPIERVTIYAVGTDHDGEVKVYECEAKRGVEYMLDKYGSGPFGYRKRIPRREVDESREAALKRFIRNGEHVVKNARAKIKRVERELKAAKELLK